jgi:hypothetical protein
LSQDYLQLTESPVKLAFDSLLKKRPELQTKLFKFQPGLTATIKVKKTVVFFTIAAKT